MSINLRKKVEELQRFGEGRVLRISTTYGNQLESVKIRKKVVMKVDKVEKLHN